MTLTLELNPEEEARLKAASHQLGIDPAIYAKQLVTEHLPAAVEPSALDDFEKYLAQITRPLSSIPADKQTREYIYED